MRVEGNDVTMMPKRKKCIGPCGRTMADTSKWFQPVVGRNADRVVLRKKCRACTGAETVAARKKKREAWLATVRADGKLTCTGPCGRERPIADFTTASGRVRRHCKACRGRGQRVYRRTKHWKKWHVENRPRARELAKATKRRALAAGALSHPTSKTQQWINQNVARGKLVKPDICSRCPHGKAGGYRIAGHLPPGKMGLAAVEWYCYPCLWKIRHPKTEDDLVDERERDEKDADPTMGQSVATLLRNLAIDRAEFAAIHRERAAITAAEDRRLLIVEVALGARAAFLERVDGREPIGPPLECVLGHWIPKSEV